MNFRDFLNQSDRITDDVVPDVDTDDVVPDVDTDDVDTDPED
jgi:hypothetical protein